MNQTKDLTQICQLAKKLGAKHAQIVDVNKVVVGNWVRMKCQYGCARYGEKLTCPPYTPIPDEFRRVLDGYSLAILLRFELQTRDDFKTPTSVVTQLEREAFLLGYHSAFGLGFSTCYYCTECTLEGCIHPELARPSMEACGTDVYITVRNTGFNLNVVKNRDEQANFFWIITRQITIIEIKNHLFRSRLIVVSKLQLER
jgi:predicted metal-binding protein